MPSPGVPPLNPDDLKNPEVMMEWFDRATLAINTLFGLHGDIPVSGNIDMQGTATIKNLAVPVHPGDAVSLSAAQDSFGPAAIQPQIEATGNSMLQTARRLNDQNQREQHSSFLNDVLNIPPSSNNSSVTVVNNGNGTTTATVSANNWAYADGAIIPYAQRADIFTNPGAGSNTYYYYFRKSDNTLQFVGPFTSATSFNALGAYTDGRGPVAKATINAGGGGTGAGGGDTAIGGCTEIGTKLEFPDGAEVTITIEPCDYWYEVAYEGGEKIAFAAGTLLGMFMRVNDSKLWAGQKDGGLGHIQSITYVERKSYKQVVKVKPHGIYWVGRGKWTSHNFKPSQ